MMNSDTSSCKTCSSWWRLPLLLGLVLVVVWLLKDRAQDATTTEVVATASEDAIVPTGQTVSLAIDFGDGEEKEYPAIGWRDGMTVRDVMLETVRENGRLEVRGSGEAAFLAGLDGKANEGDGGRNWLYSVNGEAGDRSFAIRAVRPGDRVLWKFVGQQ